MPVMWLISTANRKPVLYSYTAVYLLPRRQKELHFVSQLILLMCIDTVSVSHGT